jgi:hypothetical protein
MSEQWPAPGNGGPVAPQVIDLSDPMPTRLSDGRPSPYAIQDAPQDGSKP